MFTIEACELEAELSFGARADGMTVLGISANANIRAAVQSALRARKRVIANLYGVTNPTQRAKDLEWMGIHELVAEIGVDRATGGSSVEELRTIARGILPVLLAGCHTAASLSEAAGCGVSNVLVGRAIYSAPDVVASAKAFHAIAARM